ncbi:hypothetical protein FRB94_003762 [Tulasnella sp. JGI-2019a]|nr:hypothetical protein FRB93_012199 [Tulasnella sp. JGI-2019a]KAG9002614.1 hypothetical protein FRB94_003762 [Tulasnella sp. JGI-2019a]KAG9031551.1 hypothetical protein FRB95_002545 [Tulasnella sp. JGI-2019a]
MDRHHSTHPSSNDGSDSDSPASNPGRAVASRLKKGSACVECRSRKKRCDGKRPICSPCLREKRECTHDESKSRSRTRTQDLMNRVEELQSKLSELQVQASQASAAAARQRQQLKVPSRQGTPSSSSLSSGMTAHLATGEWWMQDPPPRPIQKHLLEISVAQRHRFLLPFHLAQFWESVYSSSPPLPALLNAMYLLACYYSGNPLLVCLEMHYVARVRKMLAESLGARSTSLVQWIQASTFLAFYLSCRGRYLEARHELAGVVPILMLCKLHTIRSSVVQPFDDDDAEAPSLLPPPKDDFEVGERICVFWMAYHIDLLVALICGLPPNKALITETTTVWPRTFEEYDQGFDPATDGSVQSLFGTNPARPFSPPCSMLALRMKASAIHGRVSLFAMSCTADYARMPEFFARLENYHRIVAAFMERLPPLAYDPSTNEEIVVPPSPVHFTIFSVRTANLGTFIQLYNAAGLDLNAYDELYRRRLLMAREATALARTFLMMKLPIRCLSMNCTLAWFPVSRVIAQHARKVSLEGNYNEMEQSQADLATMMEALKEASSTYPYFAFQLDRLRAYVNGGSEEDLSTHAAVPMTMY